MRNWILNFRKKKKQQNQVVKNVAIKPINYHPKVILAWAKAVEGDDEFMLWLKENGFEELTMATFAIYLKDEAREWLMENGYAHLMAMIHAAEGNEEALNWLKTNNFELLYFMALAIDGDEAALDWIKKNASPDLGILTISIKHIKDKIEENHNDIHSFRKDI